MSQYKNIPQLVFGDCNAEKFNNPVEFGKTIDKHAPRVRSASGLGTQNDFKSKFTAVVVNQTKMMAFSHSSLYVEKSEVSDCRLWVPLMGEHYHTNEQGTYRLVESESILFDQSHDKSIKSTRG